MYIVLHKTRMMDAVEASEYLCEKLGKIFGEHLKMRHGCFRLEIFDVVVDIRHGVEKSTICGIKPDSYYSDNETISSYLNIRTSGKRISTVEEIPGIIFKYFENERR